MDYIEKCLLEVEQKLSSQPEEEVRENVLKTIVGLKKEYPNRKGYINAKLKEICQERHKALFEEINTIDYIDSRLSAVKDIICSQTVKKYRKNVLETIVGLKRKCLNQEAYIDGAFKEICQECHVDLFEEIRKSPEDLNLVE